MEIWIVSFVLALIAFGLMFVKGGKWTLAIQIIAVLTAIGGVAAMMVEYYDHDLAHMSTIDIGGTLAVAGIWANALGAALRWHRKNQKEKEQ